MSGAQRGGKRDDRPGRRLLVAALLALLLGLAPPAAIGPRGAALVGPVTARAQAAPATLTAATIRSTGGNQATGACAGPDAGRAFFFRLTVQADPAGPVQDAVAAATLPDGVEFCGAMSTDGGGVALAPAVVGPDPVTGRTTLTWSLGSLAAGQRVLLQPLVVIGYAYRGTANGAPTAPVPDRAELTASATLTGSALGVPFSSGP